MGKLVLFTLLLFLTACGEQQKLEDLAIVNVKAIDASEEAGKLNVGISYPKSGSGEKQTSEYLSMTAKTIKEARTKISRKTQNIIVTGQLRSIVIGEDLAKSGMWNYMDGYQRDPIIGERTRIIIASGKANDLISHKYEGKPSVGDYLDKLILRESKVHESPDVNVYSFARDYYDDGIDPIAPLVKRDGNFIEIDGISLFSHDRLVGKINSDDTVLFSLLYGNLRKGEVLVPLDNNNKGNESVTLSSLMGNRTIKVRNHEDVKNMQVDIHLNIRGSIREYQGNADLGEKDEQDKLSARLSERLHQKLSSIIAQLQQNNADSLGIGKYIRNSMSYAEWKKTDWKKIYPDVKINVILSVLIKDFGIKKG